MQYWIQFSRMILYIMQISLRFTKKINFRSISGVRNFENFISGFRWQHQKIQNLILGGVLKGIFKFRECFVPQKSIFHLFGQKWPARMVTVKYTTMYKNLTQLWIKGTTKVVRLGPSEREGRPSLSTTSVHNLLSSFVWNARIMVCYSLWHVI